MAGCGDHPELGLNVVDATNAPLPRDGPMGAMRSLSGGLLVAGRGFEPGRSRLTVCVLCGAAPASAKGEHVYTRWLQRHLWPKGDNAPFKPKVNGSRFTKRDGVLREDEHFEPLFLPVCDELSGRGCNQRLSDRFEQDGTTGPVKTLFAGHQLSEVDVRRCGEWWLKTGLLAHHPAAYWKDGVRRGPVWEGAVDAGLYLWLAHGWAPPKDVSVWVARLPAVKPDPEHVGDVPLEPSLDLPTYEVGGVVRRSLAATFALGKPGRRHLAFHLLAHPGFDVAHPLEDSGYAVRLFPWAGGDLEISKLPQLDSSRYSQWRNFFGPPIRLLLGSHYHPHRRWLLTRGWTRNILSLQGVVGAAQ